jgi:F420-non-reducing hydrogenase iron-sulfur subunit
MFFKGLASASWVINPLYLKIPSMDFHWPMGGKVNDRKTVMNRVNMELNVAIFFCQQLDPDQDSNRRVMEKELGPRIKFFPLPCSGRIEALHFLRAFESGADLVYLITCPKKVCRYQQGNVRAGKRSAYAQKLIREVGLDPERLILIVTDPPLPKKIDVLTRELLAAAPIKGHSLLNRL